MPDNLTIQISADSSKLRADLKLAQASLRDVRKELNKATEEARKTGDKTRLLEVSKQYEGISSNVRYLTRALAEQNRVADAAAGSMGKLGTALATVDARLGGIIGLAGGLKTAFAGFTVLEGTRAALNQTSDALQRFRDVRNAALASTIPLNAVKAFDQAMVQAGISSQKSAGAMIQFGTTAGDAFSKWQAANKELTQSSSKFVMFGDAANKATANINVMRGSIGGNNGLTQVIRGGEKALDATRDIFASIDIDIAKFVNSAGKLDVFKLWEATIKRIAALMKAGDVRGARAGGLLLGEDDVVKLSKAVQILAADFENLNKNAANLEPTPDTLAKVDKYDEAVARLTTRWNNFWARIAAGSLATDRALAIGTDRALTGFETLGGKANAYAERIRTAISGAYAWVAEKFTEFLATEQQGNETRKQMWTDLGTWIVDTWKSTFASLYELAQTFWSWFTEQASKAWAAAKPMLSAPGGVLPAPGLAAGGMIHGPGSGTSDSILARLSNGEFVMRAAAVRAWGPQLLSAMNALNRPLRGIGDSAGFANGGMVSARTSDGATVNLHFPGGSFALRGDKGIVMGLTREARRSALLSGGRLPGAAFG